MPQEFLEKDKIIKQPSAAEKRIIE
jgi:hypothetical protein